MVGTGPPVRVVSLIVGVVEGAVVGIEGSEHTRVTVYRYTLKKATITVGTEHCRKNLCTPLRLTSNWAHNNTI